MSIFSSLIRSWSSQISEAGHLSTATEDRDDIQIQHLEEFSTGRRRAVCNRRVSKLAKLLAEALDQPPEWQHQIREAAPLHDLGKLWVPDEILEKPGPLTEEEYECRLRVENHVAAGGLKRAIQVLSHKPPLATWMTPTEMTPTEMTPTETTLTGRIRSSAFICSSAGAGPAAFVRLPNGRATTPIRILPMRRSLPSTCLASFANARPSKISTNTQRITFAEDHFPEWFPDLPSYGGYVQRLNRLSAAFAPLTEAAIAEVDDGELIETLRIADSFPVMMAPVMMAKEKRSSQAKVAPQIADKGYCSSKDTFYHGVKLSRSQTARGGTEATRDDASSKPGWPDGRIKKRFAGSPPSASCLSEPPVFQNGALYGDKAYVDSSLRKRLSEEQNMKLLTPPKKSKGQDRRLSAADKLLSEAVSRVLLANRIAFQLD